MRPLLDLSAPILPGRGLAGLGIGCHVVQYGELLSNAEANYEDEGAGAWKEIFSLWEARFRFSQVYDWTEREFFKSIFSMRKIAWRQRRGRSPGELFVPDVPDPGPAAVELAVDIRDGLVFALRALAGYEGKLFDTLHTGMTGAEAIKVEPRLRYEESEGGFVVDGQEGVLLALGPYGYDLSPEEIERASVEEIWVFDPRRAENGVLSSWPPEIQPVFDE